MKIVIGIVALVAVLALEGLMARRSTFCCGAFRPRAWIVRVPGGEFGLAEYGIPGLSTGLPDPTRSVLKAGPLGSIPLLDVGRRCLLGLLLGALVIGLQSRGLSRGYRQALGGSAAKRSAARNNSKSSRHSPQSVR